MEPVEQASFAFLVGQVDEVRVVTSMGSERCNRRRTEAPEGQKGICLHPRVKNAAY